MISPSFVQFTTADGLLLPGLFYNTSSNHVAIFLHGNGSSSVFYKENYDMAESLVKQGISVLLFNNRGAHLIKKFTITQPDGTSIRKSFGMAYERIKDCVYDIDAAIAFAKEHGKTIFSLIGSSTGANKICVYNHYQPDNPVSNYVLLSGGDDTGIYYTLLGEKRFKDLLEKAKRKSDEGQGEVIMQELLPEDILSYQSFFDMANPNGDYNVFPFHEALTGTKLSTKPLFHFFQELSKPTFVLYGTEDEYCYGKVPQIAEILKKQNPHITGDVIQGADHSLHGYEKQVGNMIATWLLTAQ